MATNKKQKATELQVKYKNELNTQYCFTGLDRRDLKIIFYLLAQFRYSKHNVLTFLINDIFDQCNLDRHHTSASDLMDYFDSDDIAANSLIARIANVRVLTQSPETKCACHMFSFKVDRINKTVSVYIDLLFREMISGLSKEFTTFDFDEFIQLKSIYSMNLYRKLSQFNATGKFRIIFSDDKNGTRDEKIVNFMNMLGYTPDPQRPLSEELKYFNRKCLLPAIAELAGNPSSDKLGKREKAAFFEIKAANNLFLDPATFPQADQGKIRNLKKEARDAIILTSKAKGAPIYGYEINFKVKSGAKYSLEEAYRESLREERELDAADAKRIEDQRVEARAQALLKQLIKGQNFLTIPQDNESKTDCSVQSEPDELPFDVGHSLVKNRENRAIGEIEEEVCPFDV